MSFMEFWGERVDPGEVGKVEFGTEHEVCQCKPLVAARFVAVVVGLPVIWAFAIPHVPMPTLHAAMLVIGGTLIYVALAYLITPQPDMDNLGWAGGLIDHPWRYSDDLNRGLLGLAIVLGPGRFVAESVLDVGVLFRDKEEAVEEDDEGSVSL